jgi:large subunit ribosomal protein L28
MPSECFVCKKRKTFGGSITRRGLAKVKGGIGTHVVKNVRRTFKANLQPVRIKVGESVQRVKVCTRCIRSGLIVKG